MTLRGRLIGGAVDGLMLAIDTIASFWQTPREVEWAKAAADGLAEREAEEEVAEPLSHWKVGDSYCGLCGENITAVSFHACPMRNKPEPKCGPNGPQCDDKWCMYCVPLVAPKTSAPTPVAVDGPAVGSPDKPTAVVTKFGSDYRVDDEVLAASYRPGEHEYPSAEVEPPASAPSAESPAPEFDWVTTAIPVIAGVLAEHVPSPVGMPPRTVFCGNADRVTFCAEFADMRDWRAHVSPIIAAALQTPRAATSYDFLSGDRPRPLADFPKHQ